VKIEFPFVAVDWGTTRMRATLCAAATSDNAVRIEGPGIAKLGRSPAEELFSAIEPWTRRYGRLALLLGGMVGSDIGWRATRYLPCPLRLAELAKELLTFSEQGHQVAIVPGLMCTNWLGQPDVMRGEEVQVLGWSRHNRQVADALICLPGTHTKWVQFGHGQLERFLTSVTGELHELLKRHSVLIRSAQRETSNFDAAEFRKGVEIAIEDGGRLLQNLFSVRSRSLLDPAVADNAPSYLSGMLVGSDVRLASERIEENGGVVELIGSRTLCDRYAVALAQLGYESRMWDGNDMALAGFVEIAEASL
jgi:2-dehydro-3-deoxygalactonokinase